MGEGLSHWSSMVLRKSQTCFFDRHTHPNSMYSNFCHVLKKRILSLHDFNAIDQDSKEDLIQDVLIKVLTKIEFYEFDNSSFYNWLYILTQNTYLDIIRKKKGGTTL